MSYNLYETPDDWAPDSSVINSTQGIQWLAWRIGIDPKRSKSLWLIAPVVDVPDDDLADLLPDGYTTFVFRADTTTYGHNRSILTKDSIAELEAEFTIQLAEAQAAVAAGHR